MAFRRRVRWMLAAAGVLLLALHGLMPAGAAGQAFPVYSSDEILEDPARRETWVFWPFYRQQTTSSTLTVAVHPLFSYHKDRVSGESDLHILWPLLVKRWHPERRGNTDFKSTQILPIYYSQSGMVGEREMKKRVLLPFFFSGQQGKRGSYMILFPFVWYAYNARLAVPFFPPREQTFAAIWPLIGDFRGYYNRDRIAFLLWPLFVYSSKGHSSDRMEQYSLVWPFFSIYKGPKVSGFRIWPLFSRVKKEGEFDRSYFLWPLGHHRTGTISEDNASTQSVTMFLPFYVKWRREKTEFDMVFPLYGELRTEGRLSRGYALAIYNQEWDYRKGTREDRLFWFLFRRKVPIEGFTEASIDPDATLGGGVFPFYLNTYNATKVDKRIVWPFYRYRWNKHRDYEFTREYLVPFYSYQMRRFTNGNYNFSRFIFPFFSTNKSLQDEYSSNVLHLFWYSRSPGMERNWAPLWTIWEKHENRRTGEKIIAWCKQLWRFERTPDGSERKKFNLLFVDYESVRRPDGTKSGHTRLFWGLIGRHRDPELKSQLLWMKF